MYYKIQGNNKAVKRSSGVMYVASDIDSLLEAVSNIDTKHIRIFIVDKWSCPICNTINFNRVNGKGFHRCNYCGRQSELCNA